MGKDDKPKDDKSGKGGKDEKPKQDNKQEGKKSCACGGTWFHTVDCQR